MVLNDDAELSDHAGGGKIERASIQFSKMQSQHSSPRLSFGRLDVTSNTKQLLTSTGVKETVWIFSSRTDLPQSISSILSLSSKITIFATSSVKNVYPLSMIIYAVILSPLFISFAGTL